MKNSKLSDDISYTITTYLDKDNVTVHDMSSVGTKYFTELESIPEIIESFEKYKIINDYKTIINEMMFYVKKAFYQKQCDFDSFSKYVLDKYFDIKISDILKTSDDLEDECHNWCLEILQMCNYKY